MVRFQLVKLLYARSQKLKMYKGISQSFVRTNVERPRLRNTCHLPANVPILCQRQRSEVLLGLPK